MTANDIARDPLVMAMMVLAIFGGACTLLLIGMGIYTVIRKIQFRRETRYLKELLK